MENLTPPTVPDLDRMRAALRELGKSKRNTGRATFNMLLPEIEQALQEEHPVKRIWESLRNQGLDVSLATFRKWLAGHASSQNQPS